MENDQFFICVHEPPAKRSLQVQAEEEEEKEAAVKAIKPFFASAFLNWNGRVAAKCQRLRAGMDTRQLWKRRMAENGTLWPWEGEDAQGGGKRRGGGNGARINPIRVALAHCFVGPWKNLTEK
jgi:hypothetical protein